MSKGPPDIIYLQYFSDPEEPGENVAEEPTWCVDRISETDVMYRRVKEEV